MRRNETKICILGSTGSIGSNTLSVIDNLVLNGKELSVKYLSAGKNIHKLAEQIRKYSPEAVVIEDKIAFDEFRSEYFFEGLEVLLGKNELVKLASDGAYDLAVSSLTGFSGLEPTLAALSSGNNVALANKETLVSAGHLVNKIVSVTGSRVYPIDSEHSAILQCILGEEQNNIHKVVLTASGGPFLNSSIDEVRSTTVEMALSHPNWKMGRKITIDSATMMNKGLEVIEAKWLYDLSPNQIEVIIHPQSIVHSFVEFNDGSVKAQLGIPDMRIPIQFALTYPGRVVSDFPRINFREMSTLEFSQPDLEKFKCLSIAYEAMESAKSYPSVMNSSNEAAVNLFLEGRIGFMDIPKIIEIQLEKHVPEEIESAEQIIELDRRINEDVLKSFVLN
ncbi:MAG: 1-deoxy-D-xylulose-5-phosphate reductoisomerase [Ignavibacteria bacterium]|nr:1-deoxy-D-xylulose-5-phosphate reductoisomerase [Ignavibacteria bacterium]